MNEDKIEHLSYKEQMEADAAVLRNTMETICETSKREPITNDSLYRIREKIVAEIYQFAVKYPPIEVDFSVTIGVEKRIDSKHGDKRCVITKDAITYEAFDARQGDWVVEQ